MLYNTYKLNKIIYHLPYVHVIQLQRIISQSRNREEDYESKNILLAEPPIFRIIQVEHKNKRMSELSSKQQNW